MSGLKSAWELSLERSEKLVPELKTKKKITKKQKEKQQMIQSLKKGDKVITIGGIHGTIAGIKQKGSILVLNLGKNVNITVNRSSIAGLAGATNDDDTLSEGMNA